MKIIRTGFYTVFNGLEMAISHYYGHGLSQEIDEKHICISYSNEHNQLDGFKFDSVSNKYKRDILISDLSNAFFVITKAIYKGEEFEVEPYIGDDIHFHLATKNIALGQKLGFYKLHDGYGNPYYVGEIKKNEIEKLWEERKPSVFNLPMPKGIEIIKELEIK